MPRNGSPRHFGADRSPRPAGGLIRGSAHSSSLALAWPLENKSCSVFLGDQQAALKNSQGTRKSLIASMLEELRAWQETRGLRIGRPSKSGHWSVQGE